MSMSGVGGNKFINAGEQQGGAEALNTVAQGLDQASKAGKINDSIQAFQDLPAVQVGGSEPSEPGGVQAPAEFFSDAEKFGVGDSQVSEHLKNPQFDVNQSLNNFAENRFATKFNPALLEVQPDAIAGEVTTTDGGGSTSSGDSLINAFGQKEDQIQKDTDELLNLDTSTPEGKKRALELQQEIQQLQQMEQVILGLLNARKSIMDAIIQNIGR
jgi:hypothetical protein